MRGVYPISCSMSSDENESPNEGRHTPPGDPEEDEYPVSAEPAPADRDLAARELRARELRALEAMERSAGMMRTLVQAVEHSQDVVLITEAEPVDLPGPRILYVNDAFEKMTGYTREEVLGKTPRILQGPESNRAELERLRAALKNWKPVRVELVNYRKDRTKFWVELSIVPLADENGWFTHWVSIQRETTDKNAIRAKLVESESRLRTLTETMPQLLWTASATGKCEYVSQSCSDFLGVSMEDCLGDAWAQFIHPDDREATIKRWTHAIAHQTTFIAEYRLRRRDGLHMWFLHRASPRYGMDGRLVEWVGTSTDIVVQKNSEEALRQTEKLAAVGRLASTMSHEINNPLEGLVNLLYLLDGNQSLDAAAREHLKAAQEQLGRVSEITTQSLRFHRQSTDATVRSLPEKLDSLLNLQRARMESKGIVVRRNYSGETTIDCYAGEMRQALGNVLSNAIDALSTRGLLWVRVRSAREWGRTQRQGVRVTIADTGSGIEKADLPRVFDAFFTTKGMHGTGLGLWITKGIVERHEGRIWVRSSNRRGRSGTAIVMFFPYSRVAQGTDT